VPADKILAMRHGPPGFRHLRRFVLLDIPGNEDSPMKLFQAVEDAHVSFIVLPVNRGSELLTSEDWCELTDSIGGAASDSAALFVITIRSNPDGRPLITANRRAPLVVDTARRIARQHILAQSAYDTRHPV
jgi:flagellar assembly factor FliW